MNEMKERIAKAIFERFKKDGQPPWRSPLMRESTARPYLDAADAVLAAMREPTEAMVSAWVKNAPKYDYDPPEAIESWKIMIDAALE